MVQDVDKLHFSLNFHKGIHAWSNLSNNKSHLPFLRDTAPQLSSIIVIHLTGISNDTKHTAYETNISLLNFKDM